jgi:phospholipid/cholesterol/gamma-HCH transport system substrate-binding protein
MGDQFKTFMIGLFITAAGAVIIFMLMFLHPSVGNEGKILHVRFTDIDKVSLGTRVTYGGKPVGEVVEIQEIGQGRTGPIDPNGHLYLYDLKLRVDTGVQVFNTDEVSIRTSGLLGERNIEITPMAPKKDEKAIEIDMQPIYGETPGTVEDALKDLTEVADKMFGALNSAQDLLDRARKQNLVEKITRTVEHVESITASLDKPQQWEEILANVHVASKTFNTTLNKIDESADIFKDTMFKVKRGEGTLGKFISDEQIYLRTNSILSKLETTLDDINHYGLMFQSDKNWQRLRARRVNLLQKLRTPQEFRNYFNDEVDQIYTSIARVSMVLDNLGADPYCCEVTSNPEFTKVFAELMRRVKMLEEEVRLYNTQLVEPSIHKVELGAPPLCSPSCNPSCDPCLHYKGQR